VYRAAGVALPPTLRVTDPGVTPADAQARPGAGAALGPGHAVDAPLRQLSDAFASGWMQLRGTRRRRGVDRGFVMSDHADWPGLQRAIAGTGAERVMVTHGSVAVLVRWLTRTACRPKASRPSTATRTWPTRPRPNPQAQPQHQQTATKAGA
jgi:putative mRNA 3-end processing factor